MERLTWEDYNGGCYAQDILLQDYDTATVFTGEPIDRLAAYERTNHTPEECTAAFEELAAYRAAEQDGTLLRPPCKVGDTVWANFSISGSYLKRKNRPYACTVIFIGLNQSDSGGYINVQYNGSDYQFSFDFDQIGKTVFLTLEAALKEQEGNDGK